MLTSIVVFLWPGRRILTFRRIYCIRIQDSICWYSEDTGSVLFRGVGIHLTCWCPSNGLHRIAMQILLVSVKTSGSTCCWHFPSYLHQQQYQQQLCGLICWPVFRYKHWNWSTICLFDILAIFHHSAYIDNSNNLDISFYIFYFMSVIPSYSLTSSLHWPPVILPPHRL
jgi:hypothetical protein